MCVSSIFCTRERAVLVNGSQFLHYDSVRWIPLHYRRLLPWRVMKRYRCMVVGSARGVLTVAFDERPHPTVLTGLRRLTGQAIFPVLVRPKRMHLLLQRAAFCQRYRLSRYDHYYLPRSFIHSTIGSLESPLDRRDRR
jgi:Type II secretion system (T2SS), protein E, N-terminal domain